MKEEMIYVSVDTDNVGESIGNAVLQNNVEQVSNISNNINAGVGIFSQWAESNGGKIISSGSDEAIFKVPSNSMEDLEDLKNVYEEKTGFTISIGIGASISESAKALIYAKMNGKNQITDYSPEIETAMKQNINGDFSEQVSEDESSEDDSETEEIKVPKDQVDGDYGSKEMAEGQPEHEKDMTEEEEFIHDAKENREDEADDDLIEADEEEDHPELVEATKEIKEEKEGEEEILEEDSEDFSEEEAMEDMVEGDSSGEDIDLDGKPDVQEEHGEIHPEEDDLDNDGDVEHEEAMAAEAGEEEEYTDQGDYEDEVMADEDQYLENEEGSNEEMADTLASEMGDEVPEEMGEEVPEEMGEEMDSSEDEKTQALKNVIYETLTNFKENRQYLEQMNQQNPELHTSLILCLQAMVEMAKELGFGNVEGMGEMEDSIEQDDDMLSEEDEVMSHSMADEEEDEVMADEDEDEDEEMNFEKSEIYSRIMSKVNKAFDMLKSDDMKSIEEVKEEFKKKVLSKQKTSGSKKKNSDKKEKDSKKKKNSSDKKESNDGSFCARSHKKMRSSGKDCRANEDKNSPLCSARRKFNCRGKNEEKSPVQKSEKLMKFLKKKELSVKKSREGTATERTTRHISKPHHAEGTQKGYKIKVVDNETGKVRWIDGSRGISKDPQGDPMGPDGKSPVGGKKQKTPKLGKE